MLTLQRPWQYNDQINEYYVVTEDKSMVKKSETTRQHEETQLDEARSHYMVVCLHWNG